MRYKLDQNGSPPMSIVKRGKTHYVIEKRRDTALTACGIEVNINAVTVGSLREVTCRKCRAIYIEGD